MLDDTREQRTRELAHAIWEQEGRPEGQAERHWRMAEEAVEAEAHVSAELSTMIGIANMTSTASIASSP